MTASPPGPGPAASPAPEAVSPEAAPSPPSRSAPSPARAPAVVDPRQSLGGAKLDDLFPEGEAFRGSLLTFTVPLTLAAFISSFGLYQDSVSNRQQIEAAT
jgi:hypothetical protein